MKEYIITLTVLFCVDMTGKLICLITEKVPQRTPLSMILDLFIGIVFVIWGIKLIV